MPPRAVAVGLGTARSFKSAKVTIAAAPYIAAVISIVIGTKLSDLIPRSVAHNT